MESWIVTDLHSFKYWVTDVRIENRRFCLNPQFSNKEANANTVRCEDVFHTLKCFIKMKTILNIWNFVPNLFFRQFFQLPENNSIRPSVTKWQPLETFRRSLVGVNHNRSKHLYNIHVNKIRWPAYCHPKHDFTANKRPDLETSSFMHTYARSRDPSVRQFPSNSSTSF